MLRNGVLLTVEQAEDYDKEKYAEIAKQISASNREALISYKESGDIVKYVEILAAGENSCQACLMLEGKRFLLSDELKNPTLPVKNCTGGYGYCRCTYVPVLADIDDLADKDFVE